MSSGPDRAAQPERWEHIVEQILSGDAAGQEALYDVFGRRVRFYLAHQLRAEDVEDKMHDTFLAVLAAIRAGQVREPQKLPSFVRTVAQRQVAGYIAEAVRQRSAMLDYSEHLPVVQDHPDPEQEMALGERRKFARKLLQALPEIDRQILKRFYFQGQTAELICEQLGITETQFRLRKHRAKERFFGLAREAIKKRTPQVLLRKTSVAGHY